MHGYMLVELKNLKPSKTDGIKPAENEMGILDFVREISSEEPSIKKMLHIKLTGLEDILFATDDAKVTAKNIYRSLKKAASLLERKLVFVQVVFKGKIMRGDKIWVEYRAKKLPIDIIFGTSEPETDSNGNKYYRATFNLS